MLYFKRFISILVVISVISIAFYLYVPPTEGNVESMNETVGINHLDVLCVGSSHLYVGINPIQMYRDKGIAAYDMGLGSQAPWQSYYYIKECCKYQKPKLIIFDTYMIGSNPEGKYEDYQTVTNLLSCHLSLNKIFAVMESEADNKLNILLRFPYNYDDRDDYPGLTVNKLYGEKNYWMGYAYTDVIEPYSEVPDISGVTDVSPVSRKNEKYLRLIIEYCRDNNIDLLLTNTPWPCITEKDQKYFNYVGMIADEYGVPFINACENYKEMGIDYMNDCSGGGHLNHSGVTKYTSFIEDYISRTFPLPDRRGDPEYAAYDEGIGLLDEKMAEVN